MGRSCRGICETIKARPLPNGDRYAMGHKRCSFCGLFFSIPDVRCPCCQTVLRTKPRGKRPAGDGLH